MTSNVAMAEMYLKLFRDLSEDGQRLQRSLRSFKITGGGPSQFSFCADVCSSKEQMIKKKTLKLLQKHKVDPLRLFAAESRALIIADRKQFAGRIRKKTNPRIIHGSFPWSLQNPRISPGAAGAPNVWDPPMVPQVDTLELHELWPIWINVNIEKTYLNRYKIFIYIYIFIVHIYLLIQIQNIYIFIFRSICFQMPGAHSSGSSWCRGHQTLKNGTPREKLTWVTGKSPFFIGDTSSNMVIFHCHVVFLGV